MNIKKRGIGGKAGCCSPFSERAHVCGRATTSNGNRLDQLPDIFYPSFHYFITVSDFENLYFTLEVKKKNYPRIEKNFPSLFFPFFLFFGKESLSIVIGNRILRNNLWNNLETLGEEGRGIEREDGTERKMRTALTPRRRGAVR